LVVVGVRRRLGLRFWGMRRVGIRCILEEGVVLGLELELGLGLGAWVLEQGGDGVGKLDVSVPLS